jgi:hypothetical protein
MTHPIPPNGTFAGTYAMLPVDDEETLDLHESEEASFVVASPIAPGIAPVMEAEYPAAAAAPARPHAAVRMQRVNPAVNLVPVRPQVIITPLKIRCFNTGTNGEDSTLYLRDQSEFAQKHNDKLMDSWQEINEHLVNELGMPVRKIISIYPMSGKVVWRDTNDQIQETYLVSRGAGNLPKCLVRLREIYAIDGAWNTHTWPQTSKHTKSNEAGPELFKRGTERLKQRKCTDSNLIDALTPANPIAKAKMIGNLYKAQQFRTKMSEFYNHHAEVYENRANAQLNLRIQEQDREIARTLRGKAELMEHGLDWDAIHNAIINPINCNVGPGVSVQSVVAAAKRIQEKHIAEIGKAEGPNAGGILGMLGKKDGTVKSEEKVRAREEAILAIEHPDLDTQRLLSRNAYKAFGVDDPKDLPKDPLEFQLVLKMIAVVDRAANPLDARNGVEEFVLANDAVDSVLFSGLWPADLQAAAKAEVLQYTRDMYELKNEMAGVGVAGVTEFNDELAVRFPGVQPLAALPTA